MSKRPRRSLFRHGDRDQNERNITAVLDRYRVRYHRMPPGVGFDLLVMVGPAEFWEVKNAALKWSLTKAEQETKEYCKTRGITYRVIETIEQAASALAERN
jgi:hypothetical protein